MPSPPWNSRPSAAAFARALAAVAAAARKAGVEVRADPATYPGLRDPRAGDLVARYDFRESPCVDYARTHEAIPRLWLRPGDRAGLAACLRALAAAEVPFKARGGGHSSGGQVLIEAGAVIDLGGLGRILADDPRGETITVEGGCTWLSLFEYLHRLGRRPRVLTDNLRTTVAGTLSVGGFGDASHRFGLQADDVTALEIMTLDGETHEVGPGQALFDYSLCGRGQLGVVVGATLRTRRIPARLRARIVTFATIDGYCAAAQEAARRGYFDFFRARLEWVGSAAVRAVVGVLGPQDRPAMETWSYPGFAPDEVSTAEDLDLFEHLRIDPGAELEHAGPALEVVFPAAEAATAITRFANAVRASGLDGQLGHGASLLLLPNRGRLPLSPLPPERFAVMLALRPRLSESAARGWLPAMRTLGHQALEGGARLYLMSVEPGSLAPADFLDRQFGPQDHRTLVNLKNVWDPKRLLNPWLV